jgi:heme-binding NEAT domain protein
MRQQVENDIKATRLFVFDLPTIQEDQIVMTNPKKLPEDPQNLKPSTKPPKSHKNPHQTSKFLVSKIKIY